MTSEEFNKWRVMPRILMVIYYGFFIYAFMYVVDWFMNYDFSEVEDPAVALAITGFPTAILAVLTGVLSTLTKQYFNTGSSSE